MASWLAIAIALAGLDATAAYAAPSPGEFASPAMSARPWVYWFWMDGNLSRDGITADLEAMSRAGIGGMIIMEVDVGIPRGPVQFMSEQWRALFRHAVREAERLNLQITLNAGPGWTGSGGPWVKPAQSMQHLVGAATEVTGPAEGPILLPRPAPRDPHVVHVPMPPAVAKAHAGFYEDVAVLAYPTPTGSATLADVDEKALYYRMPYSSCPGVSPNLPAPADFPSVSNGSAIDRDRVIDVSAHLRPDGRLAWPVPAGRWTVLRLGRTITGANTRPSPTPGIGLECDKFDRAALEAHFDAFVGTLLRELGPRPPSPAAGWTMLHIDSWEMGSQNWTGAFRDEFRRRRGYDPLTYLPAVTGRVVGSLEISERFLWDLRQTASELIVENHAGHLKTLAHRNGFGLSIEPYDLTPCADLDLGGVADVPMCEFWSRGYGFNTTFSCIEGVSAAHTEGRPIVAAEAFTAGEGEAWRLYPGNMKVQADWAFCFGINRLVFHRYAHQPWLDRRPGMTMGPYGIHYERTQTWWNLSDAWHDYLARCQFMLRRGRPVADICYVAAEGAPHVFRPPVSALTGEQPLPDRRGYNFDGCSPATLRRMQVKGGCLVLPEGMSYRVLVLPEMETMTPGMLGEVKRLVEAGAVVVGLPPRQSPSLSGYPACDARVRETAGALWEEGAGADGPGGRASGKGRVIRPRRRPHATNSPPVAADLLGKARWIWKNQGAPAAAAPVGQCRFRRPFPIPEPDAVTAAWLVITADNGFTAELNGRAAGEGDNFTRSYTFDVRPLLRPGLNELAVVGQNGGATPNPAGLIAALEIRYRDGRGEVIATDSKWEAAGPGGSAWAPAAELGTWGMAPWGRTGDGGTVFPSLYGDYQEVGAVLAGLGVTPDFESDLPLRYTHRSEDDADIYFVANGAATSVTARCRFRVAGRVVRTWDPVTGRVSGPLAGEAKNGRTEVVLTLAPQGSIFAVFEPLGPALGRAPGRESGRETLAPVAGPWKVRFDPASGGPGELTLDTLGDWSKHSDPRVRYYSGEAVYSALFQAPGLPIRQTSRVGIDLGRVEVMARVRLNGRDLGVAWTSPYRVEVPAGVLQAGENRLEIVVANLWPNRLIRDAALPERERVSWTTWNPYQPGTPLLESGLLGPVNVVVRDMGGE
jgi:hypothetical protein